MTEQASIIFIDPVRDDLAGVFSKAEDGTIRAFYDMNAMAQGLASALIPKALVARLSGDEMEAARVEGAKWVIDSIVASRDSLIMEAQFNLPDSEQ